MNQPLVSILINNYNYGSYLNAAIDSSLNQTYLNTEIIVVDDGSTDSSQEIIRSYGDKIKPVFKPNGGQASAFNAGFVKSSGNIICFLDSDDIFLPTKVEEVIRVFAKFNDIDWVFHPLFSMQTDELKKDILNPLFECKSQLLTIEEIDFRDSMRAGELPRFVPQTSAFSFSRKILKQIFPIPEDRKTYLGDTYLAMACVSQSKGCVIDKKISIYRLHGDNAYSNKEIIKSRETFMKLHLVTGYWLRTNFSDLSRYTNKFFSKGLACFWLSKNPHARYKEFIKNYFAYLSTLEKILVIMLSAYYFQKTLLRKSLP
ncbi:glycosyltransferase family 2 protein [Chamaesiphon minutus]|uniref:Glycosyl transferase n=1 Tax=Chamaesiphon minutus (strain ATCC 27169 / PCC 6605) TaxID=1173020 RepID=K9UQT1_CHAP6|nr:glycosyltransferase [Chamaesiphon minutus]AFY96791.1 glycosyl transferase [Chamaesiphon minutus PCC 6605]